MAGWHAASDSFSWTGSATRRLVRRRALNDIVLWSYFFARVQVPRAPPVLNDFCMRDPRTTRFLVSLAGSALLTGALGSIALSAGHVAAGEPSRELRAASMSRPFRPTEPDKDSINMRKDLQKRITRFHRTWRNAWQESLIKRGQVNINLGMTINDYSFRNFTPEARRYQALLCNAGWIGEAGMAAAEGNLDGTNIRAPTATARAGASERLVSAAMAATESLDGEMSTPISVGFLGAEGLEVSRRIRGDRNKGQVCPLWIADDDVIPIDEGERIDFALPVPKRPWIRRSRDTVITRLTEAAQKYPGDGWVAGQRIRFLVDNADLEQAVEAARECRASEAWCSALLGYAHEQSGNFPAADSAFRRGVAAEFSATAGVCVDTTVFVLLAPGPRRSAHGKPCAEQREIADKLWWLADPMWGEEGNERFAIHYSRRTSMLLRSAFDEDERYVWRAVAGGEALQEAIMRYGWPTHTYWGGWSMDSAMDIARQSVMMQPEPPYTSKEYAPDRVALVPSYSAIDNPFESQAIDWPMERPDSISQDSWWPFEHLSFPSRIATLNEGQSFMLRRDTSVLYGVAIDDPVHMMQPNVPSMPRLMLLASSSPDRITTVSDTLLSFGRTLRTGGHLAPQPQVLSIEVPGRVPREIAHRRRFGITPPPSLAQMSESDVAVSDPVFVVLPQRGAAAPTDPSVVRDQMAGSLSLPRSVPFALYWESYGFAPGDTVDVEIRIARRDETSALRRLGAVLGVADAQRDSISIKWREPDPGRSSQEIAARIPTVTRAISIDLRNLVSGTYVFMVQMARPDGTVARGERRVTIVE